MILYGQIRSWAEKWAVSVIYVNRSLLLQKRFIDAKMQYHNMLGVMVVLGHYRRRLKLF